MKNNHKKDNHERGDNNANDGRGKREGCKYFRSSEGCKNGSKCGFLHNTPHDGPEKKNKRIPCKNFQGEGGCKYGEKCTFLHGTPPSPQTLNMNKTPPSQERINTSKGMESLNPTTRQFLKSIEKKWKGNELQKSYFLNQLDVDLWKSALSVAASKEYLKPLKPFIRPLLLIYLCLPETVENVPNLLDVVILLKEEGVSAKEILDLDFILQVFERRLISDVAKETLEDDLPSALEVLKELDDLERLLSENLLNIQGNKLKVIQVIAKILEYLQSFQKVLNSITTFITKKVTDVSLKANDEADEATDWFRKPTMKWLLSGNWYKNTKLLVHYDSIDHYASTLQTLWIQLSFYWGLAAFWPKCRYRISHSDEKDVKICNSPMLCSPHISMQCSMKFKGRGQCTNPAGWTCPFRNHDGCCNDCALKKIENATCSPDIGGYDLSTDVYDGTVCYIKYQNDSMVIDLTHLASRKPPEKEVNWRTSYRLQPACLVGVVLLSATKAKIPLSSQIYWGEIILKEAREGDFKEYERRKKGLLTIRLLSKADSELLPTEINDKFTIDSKVAVIDCRVFVPEVFSVLSTISNPNFKTGLERLPFKQSLLGLKQGLGETETDFQYSVNEREMAIADAVNHSNIPAISRLSNENKATIIRRIRCIQIVKSLDRTQLEAFCKGLKHSLHCTQGPPGTGKSYVGVCLVLALVSIRELLIANGYSIGPILALSYKNHALDEFLNDVKNGNELFRLKGKLIRIGKPELEELLPFTEKGSVSETDAKQELDNRLAIMRQMEILLQRILSIHAGQDQICGLSDVIVTFNGAVKILPAFLTLNELTEKEAFDVLKDFLRDWEVPREFSFVQGVKHWRLPLSQGESRMDKLFFLWLEGAIPPTRCLYEANGVQCIKSAIDDSNYCIEFHRCKFQECINSSLGDCRFCENHKCQDSNCINARISSDVKYCGSHVCPNCYNLPKIHEGCINHTCVIKGCNNLTLENFDFCLDHLCIQCHKEGNITSEAIRMEVLFPNQQYLVSNYCSHHKCSVKLCGKKALLGLDYCRDHSCIVCGSFTENSYDFCNNHRCSFEDGCMKPRVIHPDNHQVFSDFCSEHTCSICIQLHQPLHEPAYAPRLTCFNHQLCEYLLEEGEYCNCLVDPTESDSYCVNHTQRFTDGKCNGVARKTGKPCKSHALPGKFFCADHEKQQVKNFGENKNVIYCVPINYTEVTPHPARNGKDDEARIPVANVTNCCEPDCGVFAVGHQIDSWKCFLHRIDLTCARPKAKPNPKPVGVDTAVCTKIAIPIVGGSDRASGPILGNKDFHDDFEEDLVPQYNDEAINGKLDPDEMEFMRVDNEDPVEEDDNERNRLKELYQEEQEDDEDTNGVKIDYDAVRAVNSGGSFDIEQYCVEEIQDLLNILDWSWTMNKDERRLKFSRFTSTAIQLLSKLMTKADLYIDEARRIKAVASAMSLKQATVIGGTIVGAARRLPALRAAEPFAIIVEEACEVMEPTLVSVLAVPSLQKLELIGDQRQLPASVQNCWYNIEISNRSIKRSLFERLVEMEDKATKQCTLLDVQRRMRFSVSVLTKHHYADVVQIIDHERTKTQQVGDRISGDSTLVASKKLWSAEAGQLIPGLQSSVYFWHQLDNKESKPKVGLSACNENEAEAVTSLVQYLIVLCGVPRSCITIITPYQGQKRELVNHLRKQGLLDDSSGLVVSTVDRYQGDENDIVILSLVRSRPGNQFVRLLNRFIVASSRARLGYYIVGSVDAVVQGFKEDTPASPLEGEAHWKRFIGQLQTPDPAMIEDDHFPFPRVSSTLPLCCPQHRDSMFNVSSQPKSRIFPTLETWNSFCQLSCTSPLKCGHNCDLPCHVITPLSHNKSCQVKLKRECLYHESIPVECKDLSIPPSTTLEAARLDYKCTLRRTIRYPSCVHELTDKCHKTKQMEEGLLPFPPCIETVTDFILPSCGHVIQSPKCSERQRYHVKAPVCMKIISQDRACGHRVISECSSMEEVLRKLCRNTINIPRPRCGHLVSLLCFQMTQLKEAWLKGTRIDINNFQEIEPVNEVNVNKGESYAVEERTIFPEIPRCNSLVDFRLSCNHVKRSIKCWQAYEWSKNIEQIPKCTELKTTGCKICNQQITMSCHLLEEYERWNPFEINIARNIDGKIVVEETILKQARIDKSNPLWNLLKSKCNHEITIFRACKPDHTLTIRCEQIIQILRSDGRKMPSICKEKVSRVLPCSHQVKVECHTSTQQPPPQCCEQPKERFRFTKCLHELEVKTCSQLQDLNSRRQSIRCEELVDEILPRCNHRVRLICGLRNELDQREGDVCTTRMKDGPEAGKLLVEANAFYCQPCRDLPVCVQPVVYQRDCQHLLSNISCAKAFDWALGREEAPTCDEMVDYRLPICGHSLQTECWVPRNLSDWNPWQNITCRPAPSFVQYPSGRKECFKQSDFIPHLPPPIKLPEELIRCKRELILEFSDCQHQKFVECHDLYKNYSKEKCDVMVEEVCVKPDCGALRSFSCYEYNRTTETDRQNTCQNRVQKVCNVCGVNDVTTLCCDVYVQCLRTVTVTLPCNHEVSWICGQEEDLRYFSNPMNHHLNSRCLHCNIQQWNDLMENQLDFELSFLEEMIQTRFHQFFPNQVNDINIKSLPMDNLAQHVQARSAMIRNLIQKFQKKQLNSFPPMIYPHHLKDTFEENYEIVFLEMKIDKEYKPNEIGKKRMTTQSLTSYGQGLKVKKLTKDSLLEIPIDIDGKIRVLVGIAFRCNTLQNVPPFTKLKDLMKVEPAELKRINVTRKKFQDEGYDSVQLFHPPPPQNDLINSGEGGGNSNNQKDIVEYVFWQHGSVLAVNVVELSLHETCCICQDSFLLHQHKGITCLNEEHHLTCWDCLTDYINAASKPDAILTYIDEKGDLTCPNCKKAYDSTRLIAEAPKPIGESIFHLKYTIKVNEERINIQKEEKERADREIQRILQLDEISKEAEFLRHTIIDDIFTLQCPRCHQAYLDFDYCFALTCPQRTCKAGFCAWCLADCGDNAHSHVPNCHLNVRGNVYGDREELSRVHARVRLDKVKNLMRNKSLQVKLKIKEIMRKDFEDLNIPMDF